MGQAFSTANKWLHSVETLRSLYLLTWGAALGFNVWTTFIGGIVAYRTLPRTTFGLLQSKLVPAYFYSSAILSAGLVLGDVKLRPVLYQSLKSSPFRTSYALASSGPFWRSTTGLALMTGAFQLANAVYVGPATTKTMFARHRLERQGAGSKSADPNGPEMQKLDKEFTILHSASAVLNLGALATTALIGFKIGNVGLGLVGWSL